MATHDAWMPLYIGDYLKDTMTLTLEEHGAYMRLIMAYWVQNGLPDDDVKLAAVVGVSAKQWQGLRKNLMGYFLLENGRLVHDRIDQELAKAKAMAIKKKHASEKANKKRWGEKVPNGVRHASQTESQTDSQTESVTVSQTLSVDNPQSHVLLRSTGTPPALASGASTPTTPKDSEILSPEEARASLKFHAYRRAREKANPGGAGCGDHDPLGHVPQSGSR